MFDFMKYTIVLVSIFAVMGTSKAETIKNYREYDIDGTHITLGVNENASERVFWVHKWLVTNNKKAVFALIKSTKFNFREYVILEENPADFLNIVESDDKEQLDEIKTIAVDKHNGFSGGVKKDNVYLLKVDQLDKDSGYRIALKSTVWTGLDNNTKGEIIITGPNQNKQEKLLEWSPAIIEASDSNDPNEIFIDITEAIPEEGTYEVEYVYISGTAGISIGETSIISYKSSIYDIKNYRIARKYEEFAKIIKYSLNEIVVNAGSEKDGFVVFSEIYYPGWEAYVDNERTRVFKANATFRAIYAPKGTHNIRLVFRPKSLYLGTTVTIITLIVSGTAIFLHLRQNTARHRENTKREDT